MKILLIEDDDMLRQNIAAMLEAEGYETAESADGEDGLFQLTQNSCDIAVLDRMLPKTNGIEVLKQARRQGVKTPILMLTALNAVGDRVNGLDAGADDYLVKPFDMRELLARVRALTRRPAEIESIEEIAFADIVYNKGAYLLKGPKGEVKLSKKLAALLELFLRSEENSLNRTTIFNRVWGPAADVDDNIIDTYISLLRRRLKTTGSAITITANRGVGYTFNKQG